MSLPTGVKRTVFWGVHLLWLPFLVVGYVTWVGKILLFSRRSAASSTVLASFYTRWMQHQLRTRRDDAAARLMRVLPNVSQPGLHLLSDPTILVRRLTGYIPKMYQYPYPGVPPMNDQPAARTTFYDAALARHLGEIEQMVVLGAGLDTRSYRLPPSTPVRCFEVDTPASQRFKQAMLRHAGVDAGRVTFVPADFENQDWFEQLLAAGFDPGKRTIFLWESVTMYLDRSSVESTLRRIARTAPRSAVAFDYISTELLGGGSLFWRYGKAVVRFMGEPWTFGLDMSPPAAKTAAAFVQSCGLTLEEFRTFGEETAEEQAQAGFVVATVPQAA